jgi:hypothetical protein
VGELHYKYYPVPEPTVEAEMVDVSTTPSWIVDIKVEQESGLAVSHRPSHVL